MMSAARTEENRDEGVDDSTKAGLPCRQIAMVGNRIDSRDLFVATREIIIGHNDDRYRLRLTAQNKLILTK